MNKNEIYTAKIEDLSSEGMGICKIDGMAVFVSGTAIGDEIECKIVKVLKSFAFGIPTKIIKASEFRQISDCEIFPKCGGCSLRHMSYEAELSYKQKRVSDCINRIGGYTDFPISKIESAPERNHYRNKAQIPLGIGKNGELTMGFYAKNTHRIIDTNNCLLQPYEFNLVMEIFRKWYKKYPSKVYDETTNTGLIRHLYLRRGELTNELMVCVVINGDKLPHSDKLIDMLKQELECLISVMLNINKEKTNVVLGKKSITLYGNDHISDELCGLKFNISPLSFFQINRTQAENLYNKALEYAELKPTDTLLDLYCGTGTIGLSMAKKCNKLIGVEIVAPAIENAKVNAKLNNIDNAEFICADASKASIMLKERGEKPDVIILDPPRKGCDKTLIETVSEIAPNKIVYISCDPATLARDLKIFKEHGYKLKKATPFDLFPSTAHIETVVLLSQQRPSDKIGVELKLDEIDLTSAEQKATYQEIKDYVLKEFDLKVSTIYISQIKKKCGLEVGKSYNTSKKDNQTIPQCPKDKENAIKAALKYFKMI